MRISPNDREDVLPPSLSDAPSSSDSGVRQSPPSLLDNRIGVAAALKAGIVGVLLGIIPLLGSALTGALAVFLYYRGGGGIRLTASSGWRLGARGGAVAFVISSLFTVIDIFVFHAQKESEDAMLRLVAAMGADPTSPDILAGIHALFTPWGMTVSFLFGLIITVAMASIGGALAASFFNSRSKR